MKNIFLLLTIIILITSCAKEEVAEKSEEVSEAVAAPEPADTVTKTPAIPQEQQKVQLFASRASEYFIEYNMKVSGPQQVEGTLTVSAKNFQDSRYANIVTTTKMVIQGNEVLTAM